MGIPITGYVAAGTFLIPAAVGLARYTNLDKAMRLFAVFSLVACINVALEYVLASLKIRNYILADIYYLVEIAFVAIIYHLSVAGKATRTLLNTCLGLYSLLWLVDELFLVSPDRLNNVLSTVSKIVLVVMSIVTLNTYLRSASSRLTREPIFWILAGMILYSSGSFVVFGLSNELLRLGRTYFDIGWHINWILLIVANLLYTKGLLCKPST